MAQKFRSKPVEIEAVQWDGSSRMAASIIDWIDANGGDADYGWRTDGPHSNPISIAIETLEGIMHASEGDWIIRGTEGEFYPVKPSVFARKYEAVQ